jgi:hypothetical protein
MIETPATIVSPPFPVADIVGHPNAQNGMDTLLFAPERTSSLPTSAETLPFLHIRFFMVH